MGKQPRAKQREFKTVDWDAVFPETDVLDQPDKKQRQFVNPFSEEKKDEQKPTITTPVTPDYGTPKDFIDYDTLGTTPQEKQTRANEIFQQEKPNGNVFDSLIQTAPAESTKQPIGNKLGKEPLIVSDEQRLKDAINLRAGLEQEKQRQRTEINPLSKLPYSDIKLENAPESDAYVNAVNTLVNTGLKTIPGTIEAIGLIGDMAIQSSLTGERPGTSLLTPKPIISGGTDKVGSALRERLDEIFPIDDKRKGFVESTLPSALGSAAGFMLGGKIAQGVKIPTFVSTLLLSTSQAAEEYKNTLQATGGDRDKAYQNFVLNLPWAATEVLPFENLFKTLNKIGTKSAKGVLGKFEIPIAMFQQGTVEGMQEVVQQFGSNLSAKQIYDAQKDLSEGTFESGAAGFFTGVLLMGLGSAAQRKLDEGGLDEQEVKDLTKTIEEVNLQKLAIDKKVRESLSPVNAQLKVISEQKLQPPTKPEVPKEIQLTPEPPIIEEPATTNIDDEAQTLKNIAAKLAAGNELTPDEISLQEKYPNYLNGILRDIKESPGYVNAQREKRQQEKIKSKTDNDDYSNLNRQYKNAQRKRVLFDTEALRQQIEDITTPEVKVKAEELLKQAEERNNTFIKRNTFTLENLSSRKYGTTDLNSLTEDQQRDVLIEYNEMKKQGMKEFKKLDSIAPVKRGDTPPPKPIVQQQQPETKKEVVESGLQGNEKEIVTGQTPEDRIAGQTGEAPVSPVSEMEEVNLSKNKEEVAKTDENVIAPDLREDSLPDTGKEGELKLDEIEQKIKDDTDKKQNIKPDNAAQAIEFFQKHRDDIPGNSYVNDIVKIAKEKGYDLTENDATYGTVWSTAVELAKEKISSGKSTQGDLIETSSLNRPKPEVIKLTKEIKVSSTNTRNPKGKQLRSDTVLPVGEYEKIGEGVSTSLVHHGSEYVKLRDKSGNKYTILKSELEPSKETVATKPTIQSSTPAPKVEKKTSSSTQSPEVIKSKEVKADTKGDIEKQIKMPDSRYADTQEWADWLKNTPREKVQFVDFKKALTSDWANKNKTQINYYFEGKKLGTFESNLDNVGIRQFYNKWVEGKKQLPIKPKVEIDNNKTTATRLINSGKSDGEVLKGLGLENNRKNMDLVRGWRKEIEKSVSDKNIKPLKEKVANDLLQMIYTKLGSDPQKQIENINSVLESLPDKQKTIANKIKSIAEVRLNPELGSEESRENTLELNKRFDAEQKELEKYISDRTPEEIIADKLADGEELTAEELKIYEDTQFAPRGYKYDIDGNLIKLKTQKEKAEDQEDVEEIIDEKLKPGLAKETNSVKDFNTKRDYIVAELQKLIDNALDNKSNNQDLPDNFRGLIEKYVTDEKKTVEETKGKFGNAKTNFDTELKSFVKRMNLTAFNGTVKIQVPDDGIITLNNPQMNELVELRDQAKRLNFNAKSNNLRSQPINSSYAKQQTGYDLKTYDEELQQAQSNLEEAKKNDNKKLIDIFTEQLKQLKKISRGQLEEDETYKEALKYPSIKSAIAGLEEYEKRSTALELFELAKEYGLTKKDIFNSKALTLANDIKNRYDSDIQKYIDEKNQDIAESESILKQYERKDGKSGYVKTNKSQSRVIVRELDSIEISKKELGELKTFRPEVEGYLGIKPEEKSELLNAKAEKQITSPQFKNWFGNWETEPEYSSKVVDDNGRPLVVYSGHGNTPLYENFDPRKATAGGFYASESSLVASGYSIGKFGAKEGFENGSQYRIKGKNGKYNKKLWQIQLTEEQKKKLDEVAEQKNKYDEYEYKINEMMRWAEDSQRYEPLARRILARGKYDLQSIHDYNEWMGYNIANPTMPTEKSEPLFLRQVKNDTEEIMDALGLEWQSYDWNQPGVFPVYLNIRKPLDADKAFPDDLMKALEQASKYERSKGDREYWDTHWTSEYPLKLWIQDIKEGSEGWTTQIPKKALPILKQFGYDGIKERGNKGMAGTLTREQRGINWIAFNPEQIKSAIANKGTFDSSNKDMLLSAGQKSSSESAKEALTNFHSDSKLFEDGTGLRFEPERKMYYYTKEEWFKRRYDPVKSGFYLLKPGDKYYVRGQEIYRAEAWGGFIDRGDTGRDEIVFYGRTDLATGIEETVHKFQKEVKRTNPKLARAIEIWEREARRFAKEQGINIPIGEELFAKSFVAQSGYAIPEETLPIWKDIYDDSVAMLNESKSGEKVFDKYFKATSAQPTSDKVEQTSQGFGTEKTNRELLSAQPSKAPPDQTQTPEFKKWFKNSKVVDDSGKPLVVYHGTPEANNFDTFQTFKPKQRTGFFGEFTQFGAFFTNSTKTASSYSVNFNKTTEEYQQRKTLSDEALRKAAEAQQRGDKKAQDKYFAEYKNVIKDFPSSDFEKDFYKGVIYPVYLSLQKPLVIDAKGQHWYKVIPDLFKDTRGLVGYDGVIVENVIEVNNDIQTTYIVFKETQIKSAIANQGTFDSNNPNILLSAKPEEGDPTQIDFGVGLGQVFTNLSEKIQSTRATKEFEKANGIDSDPVLRRHYRSFMTAPVWFFDKEPQLQKVWDVIDKNFVRNVNYDSAVLKEDKWKNGKSWRKLSDEQKRNFLNKLKQYEKELYEAQNNHDKMPYQTYEKFADQFSDPKIKDFILNDYRNTIQQALEYVKEIDAYLIVNRTPNNPFLEDYLKYKGKDAKEKQKLLDKGIDEFFKADPNSEGYYENELNNQTKPDIVSALNNAWAKNKDLRENIADTLTFKKYEQIEKVMYFPSSRLGKKYYLSAKKVSSAPAHFNLSNDYYFTTDDRPQYLEGVKSDLEQRGYEVKIGKFKEAQDEILKNVVTQEDLLDLAILSGVETDNKALDRLLKQVIAKGFTKHFIPKRFVPGFQYTQENFDTAIYKYIGSVPYFKNRTIGGYELDNVLTDLKEKEILKPGSANEKYIQDLRNKLESRDEILGQGLRAAASVWYLALRPSYLAQQIVQPFNTLLPLLPVIAKELGINTIEAEKAFAESLKSSIVYYGWKIANKVAKMKGNKLTSDFGLGKEFIDVIQKLERQGVGKPLRSLEIIGEQVDPSKFYNPSPVVGSISMFAKIVGLPGIFVEDFTRAQGIRAFYLLGTKAGLKGEKLVDFISKQVAKSYGPASGRLSKPPGYKIGGDNVLSTGVRSVLESHLTFKNFAFMNFGQWGKMYRAITEDNLFRPIAYKLGAQVGLGGLKYMMWTSTVLSLLSILYSILDVPEDPEEQYEELFKNLNAVVPGLGDAFYKGVSTVTFKVDLSALFSQQAPFISEDLAFKQDLSEAIEGAPIQMAKDIYSGIEGKNPKKLVPSGIRNVISSDEYGERGIRWGNRKLMKPEEITPEMKTQKKLGFTPLAVSEAYTDEKRRQTKSKEYTDIIRDEVENKIIPLIESGKGKEARELFKKIYDDMLENNILTENQKKSVTGTNSFISQVVLTRLDETEREIIKKWKNTGTTKSSGRNFNNRPSRNRVGERPSAR